MLNWLPARLAGALIALAAPVVGGSVRRTWRTMVGRQARFASPNAGWPISAAAGALGVTLEKTGAYRVGEAAPLPGSATITRGRHLMVFAGISGALLMVLGWVVAHAG